MAGMFGGGGGSVKKLVRRVVEQGRGSGRFTGMTAGIRDPARRAGPDAGGGTDRRDPMDDDERRRRRRGGPRGGNTRLGGNVRSPLAP